MTHENCVRCYNVTGNAGKGEGSLYLNDTIGPLCEFCYEYILVKGTDICNICGDVIYNLYIDHGEVHCEQCFEVHCL